MDTDALQAEVDEWVHDGIITEAQAEQILARYETDEPRRSRAVLALSLVGTGLVFVGITLYLGTNWELLPRLARAAVLVAAPGLAYVGGFAAYGRGAHRIGHALIVLGAVLVGPSIFLFDDLFALGLADTWLLLAWTAVALPTGEVLDSRVGTGFGLLVLVASVVTLVEPADPVPVIGLLGIVLFALGHRRTGRVGVTYRAGGVAVTLGSLLVLTTVERNFFRFELEPTAMLFAGVFGALAGALWLHAAGERAGSHWTATAIGALGLSVVTAGLAPETVPGLVGFLGVHLAALGGLLATGLLGYRTRSRTLIDLAALGGLLQTLSFVASTVVDGLSGSIALVVAGLVLLAAGLALERGRRSLLAKL